MKMEGFRDTQALLSLLSFCSAVALASADVTGTVYSTTVANAAATDYADFAVKGQRIFYVHGGNNLTMSHLNLYPGFSSEEVFYDSRIIGDGSQVILSVATDPSQDVIHVGLSDGYYAAVMFDGAGFITSGPVPLFTLTLSSGSDFNCTDVAALPPTTPSSHTFALLTCNHGGLYKIKTTVGGSGTVSEEVWICRPGVSAKYIALAVNVERERAYVSEKSSYRTVLMTAGVDETSGYTSPQDRNLGHAVVSDIVSSVHVASDGVNPSLLLTSTSTRVYDYNEETVPVTEKWDGTVTGVFPPFHAVSYGGGCIALSSISSFTFFQRDGTTLSVHKLDLPGQPTKGLVPFGDEGVIVSRGVTFYYVQCVVTAIPTTAPTVAPPTTAPTAAPTAAPTDVPETPYPPTSLPDTNVPDTAAPVTDAPATAVPDTAEPAGVPSPPMQSDAPDTDTPGTAMATSVPATKAPGASPIPATAEPTTSAPGTTPNPAASGTQSPSLPTDVPPAATPQPGTAQPEDGVEALETPEAPLVVLSEAVVKSQKEVGTTGGAAVIASSAASGAAAATAVRSVIAAQACYTAGNLHLPRAVHPTAWEPYGSAPLGMVLGNSAIVVGITTVWYLVVRVVTAVVERRYPDRTSAFDFHGVLRFPSVPYFIIICLYQGIAMGSIVLFLQPFSLGPFVVGTVGLCFVIPLPFYTFAVLRRCNPVKCTYVTEAGCGRYRGFVLGKGEWVSVHKDEDFATRYASLLRQYRSGAEWYVFFDMVGSLCVACAHGVHANTLWDCGHVKAVAALIFFGMFGVELYVQPYSRPRDLPIGLLCGFAQGTAMVLMAAGFYGGQTQSWEFEVAEEILLLSMRILLVKVAADIGSELYVTWTKRRAQLTTSYQNAVADSPCSLFRDEDLGGMAADRAERGSPILWLWREPDSLHEDSALGLLGTSNDTPPSRAACLL